MIFESQIVQGTKYLQRAKNPDGGIPATQLGAISGCWTTAETLEAIVCAPFHETDPSAFARLLTAFLKGTQLHTKPHVGGWPLVVGGKRASTMATGHAVSACLCGKRYFCEELDLVLDLETLAKLGLDWLVKNQNSDGGWGVEPSGGSAGKSSRMISTVFALRGCFESGLTVDSSRIVRNGVQYILSLKNADGGFGGFVGAPSDPCNTARALVAIIRSKYLDQGTSISKRAIAYIVKVRPRKQLWPLDSEIYVTEGAPGQTTYNSNTTADVLEAFLRYGSYDSHVEDLIEWYISNQQDDGSWYLGANGNFNTYISTWSTNEAIYALSIAEREFPKKRISQVEKKSKFWRRVAIALAMIVVVLLLLVVQLPETVTGLWLKVPESNRTLIVQGVLLALVINLVSSLLYDRWPFRKHSK